MKTSSSILVTMVLLAVAALSAPGVYAFGNPITNHAHVPDHFLTYPFTAPASSKKTPKLPLRRQNRALRSMWSPKQDQLDDGKHSHSQHNDNQPHHLIADGKRALSEKTGFPLPPVPTTLSNLKATAKTGKSKTPSSTTAMNSSVPGDNKLHGGKHEELWTRAIGTVVDTDNCRVGSAEARTFTTECWGSTVEIPNFPQSM